MILAKIQGYSEDVAKVRGIIKKTFKLKLKNARHHWNDFMHMHVHITFESFWWRSQSYNIFTIHLNVFTYLLCTVLQFNQVSLASAHFKVRLVTTAWIFQKMMLPWSWRCPTSRRTRSILHNCLAITGVSMILLVRLGPLWLLLHSLQLLLIAKGYKGGQRGTKEPT